MTPAVTLEQKKQAVASPLSTPSLLYNKDGVRMNRRCRSTEDHFESRPCRRNMAGTYRGCQNPLCSCPSRIRYKVLCFVYLDIYLCLDICYCSDVNLNLYSVYTLTNLFHDAFIYSTHTQELTWMEHITWGNCFIFNLINQFLIYALKFQKC